MPDLLHYFVWSWKIQNFVRCQIRSTRSWSVEDYPGHFCLCQISRIRSNYRLVLIIWDMHIQCLIITWNHVWSPFSMIVYNQFIVYDYSMLCHVYFKFIWYIVWLYLWRCCWTLLCCWTHCQPKFPSIFEQLQLVKVRFSRSKRSTLCEFTCLCNSCHCLMFF